jgi:5-methylcytosine-specific restriction enzyme subunit McrC
VGAETFAWAVAPATAAAHAVLPAIRTDVTLTTSTQKLLIDCKYYRKALKPHYNQEKIIAAHLYQLYAYVQHAQRQTPARPVDGLLLYPVVDGQLRHSYQLLDVAHRLRVATVDLNQSWQAVEAELLSLLTWK